MTLKERTNSFFINVISCVINSQKVSYPSEEIDFKYLFSLSYFHSVANIIYYGIKDLNLSIDEKILKAFKEEYHKGIFRDAVQQEELELITSRFEENKIKFLPLKGSILKHLYPKSVLRNMADLDILIEDNNRKAVKKIMLSLDYEIESYNRSHHDTYHKLPIMNVEIHHALFDDDNTSYSYYNEFCKRLFLSNDSFYLSLSKEDFFVYLLAHLEKHYSQCGTGIKSIADVWIYLNHYKDELDLIYIDNELTKIGILEIAHSLIELCEVWFNGKETNPKIEEMKEKIILSGTYGTEENVVKNMMYGDKEEKLNLKKAKKRIFFKTLFPSYKKMKGIYPILRKLPFLLPIFYIVRMFGVFSKGKRDRMKARMDTVNQEIKKQENGD